MSLVPESIHTTSTGQQTTFTETNSNRGKRKLSSPPLVGTDTHISVKGASLYEIKDNYLKQRSCIFTSRTASWAASLVVNVIKA